MDKKKSIILAVILILLIGFGTYAFAGNNTKSNGTTNTTENSNSTDNNSKEEEKNVEEETSTETDTSYSKALAAVKNVEGTLTEEDYSTAYALVKKVTNATKKQALTDRLATVREVLDITDLVNQLYAAVTNSKSIDEMNSARTLESTNTILARVSALSDSDRKTSLLELVNEISPVLEDTTVPVITGIENGAYTKETVKAIVEDATSVVMTLNGKKTDSATLANISEEGEYTLTVTDKAFNTITISFVIDKTAPDIYLNDEAQENGGSANVGVAAVYATDDNLAKMTSTKEGEEAEEFEDALFIVDDGTYTIVATDKAGNETTFTVDVDATAPVISITGGSKSYKTPSNAPITMTLTEENGLSSVSYWITKSYNNKGNYGEELETSAIVDNGDGTYTVSIDITDKDGGYYVFAKAVDIFGNEATTKVGHFYIDTKAPVITFEGGSQSYKNFSNSAITMNIAESNGLSYVSYWITQTYDNKGNYGEEVEASAITNNGNGTYSVSIDTANKNGGYYIFAKTVDSLGNESTIKVGHFYIDTVSPVVSFPNTHSSNAAYKNWETLSITVTDRSLAKVYYTWANMNHYVAATTEVPAENITNNGDGTFTVKVPTVNGRNRLNVKVVDASGNETTTYSTAGAYNIDLAAPVITFEGGSQSAKNYSNSPITMKISEAHDLAYVSYYVTTSNKNTNYGTQLEESAITNNGDGTYSVTLDIANKNGGYYIFAKAVDKAGNETTIKAGHFYIDTVAPAVSFPNTHSSNAAYKNWETLSITVTDRSLAKVYYTWANMNHYVAATTEVPAENITNNGNGTFTIKVPTVNGRNRLNVKVVDVSGNETTTYSTAGAYNIDVTAPTLSVKEGSIGTSDHYSNVSFTLSDDVNVVSYTLNGTTKNVTKNKTVDVNYDDIKDLLIEGNNTITVNDVAGNTYSYDFVYDITAPELKKMTQVIKNPDTPSRVTVRLYMDEEIQEPSKWNLWDDTKDGVSKTFTLGSDTTTTVTIKDLAGNETTITVAVGENASISKQSTQTTINTTNGSTTVTVQPNPAEDNTKTTSVTLPNTIAEIANNNGKKLSLTAEVTYLLDSVGNPSFTVVSTNNNALGALDLTLKVNGSTVSAFKDAEGKDVVAIVTTYVAKGITDFGFNYNGTSFTVVANKDDVDAANEVWYDSTTGELVFGTTHFSTYVVEGSNTSYVESQNTAYKTLSDAINGISNNDTILMIKDETISTKISSYKDYTLDLNDHTLYGNVSYDRFLHFEKGTVEVKNGKVEVKEGNENTYGFFKINGTAGDVTLTIDDVEMNGNTNNGAFIKVNNVYSYNVTLNLKNIVANTNSYFEDGTCYQKTILNVENCIINCGKRAFLFNAYTDDSVATLKNVTAVADEGPVIEVDSGTATFDDCNFTIKNKKQPQTWYSVAIGISYDAVVTINSGTYTSEQWHALEIYTHGGTFNINGGTFTGKNGEEDAIQTYSTSDGDNIVNITGGTFVGKLELPTPISASAVNNITGGTFSADPSQYVASGYKAVLNEDNTYTVTAVQPE